VIASRPAERTSSLPAAVASLDGVELVGSCSSAAEVLGAGSRLAPDIAVIHLDLCRNGSLVEELKLRSPHTRIIAVADQRRQDPRELVDALAAGAVGALYDEEGLAVKLERAIHSSWPTRPVVAEEAAGLLLGSYIDGLTQKRKRDVAITEALVAAVEARDFGTGRHQYRASALAASCMERIDLDLATDEDVRYGFLLHDVGKIGVSDVILNKPGPLEGPEWTLMQRHPEMGVRIVSPIGFSTATTEIILRHHERWDGSGYPDGLSGEDIPLTARTFAVADAFDAMTSDRPYRRAMPAETAAEIIRLEAGGSYDPAIVDVFLDVLDYRQELAARR
jgi:HD-GYP domain-containing protein (c-di-GMP phosphodiesterase class II)